MTKAQARQKIWMALESVLEFEIDTDTSGIFAGINKPFGRKESQRMIEAAEEILTELHNKAGEL